MSVAELLRGIRRGNKWHRRRCAYELRRLAFAGRLGRRNAAVVNRVGWSSDRRLTALAGEHLQCVTIAFRFGVRRANYTAGWGINKFGRMLPERRP